LAQLNDITSTEKLLDFIRTKSGSSFPEGSNAGKDDPPRRPIAKGIAKIISLKKVPTLKAITVGIHIGRDYLGMVKATRGRDGLPVVLGQKQRTISSSLSRNSKEFVNLLAAELNDFCDTPQKCRLWAVIPAVGIDIHHIRIPKVGKKQLDSAVYWSVKKEGAFDEKENILDYEVLGEVVEQGITKLAVMYYVAPRRVIEETKKTFSDAGWPLTGLSIPPFALQNIFRSGWLAGNQEKVASLFIGNDFSRIDIFAQGKLVMTRGIKAGINSMLECVLEGLNDKARTLDNGETRAQVDMEQAKKVFLSLNPDFSALPENHAAANEFKEDEIWEMILPAFERLVRQAERTFEHFTSTMGNEKIGKIYVSMAMNAYPRIAKYVGEQLNIESALFDPMNLQISFSSEGLFPLSDHERIALAPAYGMALSDMAHTPNFIFTYKDKEEASVVKRINIVIILAFLVVLSLCTGIFAYQRQTIAQKRKLVVRLEKEMPASGVPLSRELILNTLANVKQDMASGKIYSQRYQGLAIISELSNLTPRDINLIEVKTNLGNSQQMPQPAKPEGTKTQGGEARKDTEIEGYVIGRKKELRNTLAAYVIKLDTSPLFQQIKILKSNEEINGGLEMLHFNLAMRLEGL